MMGKFLEAELSYRSKVRRSSSITLQSEQHHTSHPLLGAVNVEIDGRMEKSPTELKTVQDFDRFDKRKLKEIVMQIGGQCLATGAASGLLIVAMRDGAKMTAVVIQNAAEFHIKNIRKWMTELDIGLEQREQEVYQPVVRK